MNAYYKINCLLRDEGDVNAETVVGVLLAEGQGTEADHTLAKQTLDSAIARGNAAAAVYLAECFAEGRCFDKSPSLAIEYYVKAGALGFIPAYEKLGDIYALGELCEKNPRLAVEYYELASALPGAARKANEIKAKRRAYYESGLRVLRTGAAGARDAEDAFRSLAVATAMGETEAAVALADCYRLGFGTKRDSGSAFYWYRSAYDEGAASALMPLALCYSRGEGVAFSYKTAVKYLSLAQSREVPGAAAELDKLYRRRMKKMIRSLYSVAMSLIHQKKLGEAFSLLLESAPLGYPKALYTLGCFYEFGAGIGRSDKISAAKYYELALKGNDNFDKFSDPMSKYKLKVLKMIR